MGGRLPDELLSLVHAGLVDQCRKGHGYPVAISEAHEQAVVTAGDREEFRVMVETALGAHRLPVYTSLEGPQQEAEMALVG